MRVPYDAKYTKPSIFSAPKLYLEKDQRARICILDEDILMSLCHSLQFGDPEAKERDKRSQQYRCFGDPAIIQEEGIDAGNCPFCAAGQPIGAVKRYFVVHVVRYMLDAQWKVRKPYMTDIILWKFPQKKFDRLMRIKESHEDLNQIDLNITCVGSKYQDFEIDAAVEDTKLQIPACIWSQSGNEFGADVIKQLDDFRKPDNDLENLASVAVSKEKANSLIDELLGRGQAAPMPKEDLKNPAAMQALINGGDKTETPEPPKTPAKNVNLMEMLKQRKADKATNAN